LLYTFSQINETTYIRKLTYVAVYNCY